jgi:predicted TIM-barrel fold metal-dependent hydrolase
VTIDSADPLVRFFAERGISLPDKPLTLLDDPAPREVWCPVISVDDHAMEPPTLFDGISARFADQAPKIVDYEGRPVWLIEDDIIPIIGANAASGRPMTEYQQLALRFEEMRPGVYDPARRLADMDLNGVWASLCFPSMPWGFAGRRLSGIRDPELALACVRTYNNWVLEQWCGAAPDRFISCQLPWLRDPVEAAAEIRSNAERGFRSVSFPENPEVMGFASLYSGEWEPFLRACEETSTVINLHVGSSGRLNLPSKQTPDPAASALFPVSGIEAVIDWIFARIPTNFPEIKIVPSEAGVSWLPMVKERLDRIYGRRDSYIWWRPEDPHPVELIERNFWFTSIDDPSAFQNIDLIGVDRVMMEVDYPHSDSTWPDSQQVFRRCLGHLDPSAIRSIAYGNASRLYRHPEPPSDLFADVLGADSPLRASEEAPSVGR